MLALLLAAAAPSIGTSWHYLRSTRAGAEREHVWVHRASAAQLAVYKMRSRCTNAAFVTATIDPETGEASELVAGRLRRDGSVETFGTLRHDPVAQTLTMAMDGAAPIETPAPIRPWHLYDYDLATLAAATRARPPQGAFSFGLALVWPGESGVALKWLGRADATAPTRTRYLGRLAIRYTVGGAAFGTAGGGPLWLDARNGTLLGASWGLPNHPGYADFRLRLIGVEHGEARWRARLARHYAGCPTA